VTTLDAIPTALGVAEDAILTALNALAPTGYAAWDAHPPETVAALTLPRTGASRPLRLYTAQHQDGGGAPLPYVHSRQWEGDVLVKVFAAPGGDSVARAGMALAHAAMLALSAPAGYAIHARALRPVSLPREIAARRALLYRVRVVKVS
jgi:hypothetical protein